MPTLIPADRWELNTDKFGPNLSQSHGQAFGISTDSLLESIDEIENRPEMKELNRLLMDSPIYLTEENI